MSDLRGRATTAPVAVTTTAKTVLQLVAAANHRVVVKRISVSFTGIVATDEPIQVDIYVQTTAGTMTALALIKDNPGDDETLQTSAQHTATVEPTKTSLLDSKTVHPQSRADFGPFIIPGGTRLGVYVDAPNNTNCVCHASFEE